MSKIVFFCIPAYGHTNPTLGVVRELTARGHEVRYYSYEPMRTLIEAAGAQFVACDPYDCEQHLTPADGARVGKDIAFSTHILVETTLALDGIAIIVNPQNPVKDLSLEQIAKIYTGEITNWKDVGGEDAEIVRIGREAGSGTRDGFESITDTKDACQYRQELTSTGDVITTVSQNPNAIGYASLAAIKDSVKALTVNGVAPTEATVKDGTYLVQRPFVLVTKEGVALSETAQKFFNFATSADAASIISAAGAVPVA